MRPSLPASCRSISSSCRWISCPSAPTRATDPRGSARSTCGALRMCVSRRRFTVAGTSGACAREPWLPISWWGWARPCPGRGRDEGRDPAHRRAAPATAGRAQWSRGCLAERVGGTSGPAQPEPGLDGVDGELLLLALRDLALSTGSACTSASVEPSYVLRSEERRGGKET